MKSFCQTKTIHFGGKLQSTKRQSAGKTLKGVPEDILSIYRRQKPAYVMVWGAVSTTWKSPLSFVKQGAIVNTTVYIDDIL